MKRKLTVTFPDGTKGTRTTERKYTHVVVARVHPAGLVSEQNPDSFNAAMAIKPDRWEALSWASTKALADKAMRHYKVGSYYTELMIIKVDDPNATVRKADVRDLARAVRELMHRHAEEDAWTNHDLAIHFAPSECYGDAFRGRDKQKRDEIVALVTKYGWTIEDFHAAAQAMQNAFFDHFGAQHPGLRDDVIYYDIGTPYEEAEAAGRFGLDY